jgi:hypothetical protein
MRKDDNKGLPPKGQRNKNYFYMLTGASLGSSGQGQRSGYMVKGSMSSVLSKQYSVVEFNSKNVTLHFSAMNGCENALRFADNSLIDKESAVKLVNSTTTPTPTCK